jgi:CheY-like chemotaxis protein
MTEPTPAKRRILFVDDDPEFLKMVDRLLRLYSKNTLEILTAPSASQALSMIQDEALDLVVIDVCMPVVDGLQFLSILNRRYPGLQKVVLTGFATDAYRAACLSNGAELFLEKPRTSEGMESIFATLDELTRFKPEPGFRGVLRRVGLIDIIQMECLGRSSSLLAITSQNISGAIYIRDGSIIHAEAGELKGEEAFKQLVALQSGDFRLNTFKEPPEQTISGSWEGLLMDAAQTRDEAPEIEPPPVEALPAPEPEEIEEGERPPVSVEEFLICSEAGDVFHAYQCPNTDLRVSFLEFLSQKARLLVNVLPLGTFDRAEFYGENSRLVAQISSGRGVVLRTTTEPTKELAKPTPSAARLTPERKAKAQKWFQEHLDLAGLLAATLHFSDRSGTAHSVSPKFQADSLETLKRSVGDGFQVLRLQRFTANRGRWLYNDTAIECAQWRDGTTLSFVLSRQSLDLNKRLVEERVRAFFEEEMRQT